MQCGAGDLVVEAGQLEQEVVFVVVGRLFKVRQTGAENAAISDIIRSEKDEFDEERAGAAARVCRPPSV